jgi:HK97 family phage major capsid protein
MNLREQYAKLLDELRALAAKAKDGSLTEDEGAAFDAKTAEARALKARIDEAERRERDAAEMDAEHQRMTRSRGSVAGVVARDGSADEGRTNAQRLERRVAAASVRTGVAERFLGSEMWAEYRDARFPRGRNTGRVEVGSFFHRDNESPIDVGGMSPDELRTVISTGALPSAPAFIAPNRLPGVYTPDLPDLTVRSAFLNLQTSSPVIQFFRELAFTNNAAFVAESTTFSATTPSATNAKPESALTFESATAAVETLAHWIPVTNQTLDDVPAMRGIIEGRLIDGLRLAEDDALLNGNGTPPNISGLLDQAGTQALDAAYFGGAPVEGVGTDREDFDRITRAKRLVREVGRARASFVLLSPADLERLLTIVDTNGQYYSGSPFSDLALARMRGLRVIETEALAEGTAVVGDGRMAAVFDRMAAAVTAGWINDMFVHNMIALLAEQRLAFAVFRPAAIAVVTLAG